MLNAGRLKEYAQISQAAYGRLAPSMYGNSGALASQLATRSDDGGANFTDKEAKLFTARFELLYQSLDTSDSNGFSAAVFRDKSSGKIVVSFRGTQPTEVVDLLTDLRIGLDGYASTQTIPLYRYLKQLTTPAGQPVSYTQAELERLNAVWLDQADTPLALVLRAADWSALRDRILADTGIDAGQGGSPLITAGVTPVSFTGHSLGGHLAMLASRLVPGLCSQVVTVNAPGFFSHGKSVLSLFSAGWSSDIQRVEAVGDGFSELGNVRPGLTLSIGQENESGALDPFDTNHGVTNTADGLALAELLGKLDPRFAADARLAKGFIDQAANVANQGYEALLDALRRVIQGNNPAPTPPNAGNDPVSRNPFYVNLDELANDNTFKTLAADVNTLATKVQLVAATGASARTDFGQFLALYHLTPFALKPLDAAAEDTLKGIHSSQRGQRQIVC